jgi:hypothetical protein
VCDARQRVLSAAYATHPERFVRKPPQPPTLPHAVWINPPKEESASQARAGATISTADDLRVALNGEGLGVPSEAVGILPSVITTPTYEGVHSLHRILLHDLHPPLYQLESIPFLVEIAKWSPV